MRHTWGTPVTSALLADPVVVDTHNEFFGQRGVSLSSGGARGTGHVTRDRRVDDGAGGLGTRL